MSKRIGITLLVIALVVGAVYAIIGFTTFEECTIQTTKPTEFEASEYIAEIIYNSFSYNDGAYEYSIKININVEKLSKNATVTEKMAIEQQSKDAISAIKLDWEKRGYKIKKAESYSLSAIIARYSSYDELALANGQTGYDKVEDTATTYKGLFFNKIVSERYTVFKEESGSVLNLAEKELEKIDGVNEGEIDLVFNYGTMYKTSTISSDAEQIYKLIDEETGLYTIVHEFRMNAGNRARIISIVQTTPNVYTWYLIPIVISLILAGTIILIAGAKRSKR